MHWYNGLSLFFGGAFFANCLPHILNGVSGRPFQTPFASPPGEGLSSSTVNVLWGFFNLLMAYVLVVHLGRFDLHDKVQALLIGGAMFLMALFSARHFGRFHGGR